MSAAFLPIRVLPLLGGVSTSGCWTRAALGISARVCGPKEPPSKLLEAFPEAPLVRVSRYFIIEDFWLKDHIYYQDPWAHLKSTSSLGFYTLDSRSIALQNCEFYFLLLAGVLEMSFWDLTPANNDPEGPGIQYSRTLVPKTMLFMVFMDHRP